jgi:hypothetical protein
MICHIKDEVKEAIFVCPYMLTSLALHLIWFVTVALLQCV